MNRSHLVMFLTTSVVSGALAWGSPSSAASNNLQWVPGSACAVSAASNNSGATYLNSGIHTNSSPATIICPFVEHFDNVKGSIEVMWTNVIDGDTTAKSGAQACVQPYVGGSVQCGKVYTQLGNTFTGPTVFPVIVTSLWGSGHVDDYGTVVVTLPRASQLEGLDPR